MPSGARAPRHNLTSTTTPTPPLPPPLQVQGALGGVELNRWGLPEVDAATQGTAAAGVYVAGDIAGVAKTTVEEASAKLPNPSAFLLLLLLPAAPAAPAAACCSCWSCCSRVCASGAMPLQAANDGKVAARSMHAYLQAAAGAEAPSAVRTEPCCPSCRSMVRMSLHVAMPSHGRRTAVAGARRQQASRLPLADRRGR